MFSFFNLLGCILYPDKIVITYNFTDPHTPHKITSETISKTEGQIDSAFSLYMSSYNQVAVSPRAVKSEHFVFDGFSFLVSGTLNRSHSREAQ